jgi:hypothetical protein
VLFKADRRLNSIPLPREASPSTNGAAALAEYEPSQRSLLAAKPNGRTDPRVGPLSSSPALP